MDREILFRGLCIDNGLYIEGNYFYSQLKDKHYITGDSIDYGFNSEEVYKYSVVQFTGVTDKNGVKIFEGDIIEVKGKYKPGKYSIIWDNYRSSWWGDNIRTKNKDFDYDDDSYQIINDQFKNYEVIGTIYDETK